MYNPDFWELRLDPHDLDRFANEAAIWYETTEDSADRLHRQRHTEQLVRPILELVGQALTDKQRQAFLLYFLEQKTQEEVAAILGISRRVVSQHLFGICRNGRHVGGAVQKLRKLCRQRGIRPALDRSLTGASVEV
ncbi:MAG: sigma factor-like helix-turn-helix DNA-binding protein [Candidatus Latescibacterota bacterium]